MQCLTISLIPFTSVRSYKFTFTAFYFCFGTVFFRFSLYLIYSSKFMHKCYFINLKTYSRFSERNFLSGFRIFTDLFPDFFGYRNFFQIYMLTSFESYFWNLFASRFFRIFSDFPEFFRISPDFSRIFPDIVLKGVK